jgi:hypothetical protein
MPSCSPTFSTKVTYNFHQNNPPAKTKCLPSTSFRRVKVILSGRTQANSICQPSSPILHAMLPFLLESLRFLHQETSKQCLPAPTPLCQEKVTIFCYCAPSFSVRIQANIVCQPSTPALGDSVSAFSGRLPANSVCLPPTSCQGIKDTIL